MICIDSTKCTGCGSCIDVCPEAAISLKDDKAVIQQELCTGCGACLEMCGADAIYQSEAVAAPRLTPVTNTRRYPRWGSIAGTHLGWGHRCRWHGGRW